MGKTWRRDPYAKDLHSNKYRQRVKRDKRKELLEKLNEQSTQDFEDRKPHLEGTEGQELDQPKRSTSLRTV